MGQQSVEMVSEASKLPVGDGLIIEHGSSRNSGQDIHGSEGRTPKASRCSLAEGFIW
jgi:hypothetical protein